MNVIDFKKAKCKNCYKCVRTCEVKAISVENGQAQIVNESCILCGNCLEICPQNAKSFISQLELVKEYIKNKIPTIVSIAPSYLGLIEYEKPGQVVTALLKLGFTQVRETSEGAAYVTREYQKLINEHKMENIITTSCPSVNDLIEKYHPSLVRYMAPVISPMIAHGKLIKEKFGYEDVKVVFLGPCIAKQREAIYDDRTNGCIDAVINFIELEEWLKEEDIDIKSLDETEFGNPDPKVNRLYPVSNGVISSIALENNEDKYHKIYVHGTKECIELFESLKKGELKNCFVEANICHGGCINGPVSGNSASSYHKIKLEMEDRIKKSPVIEKEYPKITDHINMYKMFHDHSIHEKLPSELEIRNILMQTGKTEKEHELNCGACGYSSCREKAIAVYQEKAELSMCIPYMHEKAESMANVVLATTPNIIIIVDADLKICEFNDAAVKYFKKVRAEALQMYLYEFIDPSDFLKVLESHENILMKKVTYEDMNLTTLQNIVYLKEQNGVMGVFRDISEEEERNKQAYKVKVDTIEMAQKVIDKQMFVAQQIAGLLGETTAETKVTLTKLRDTILFDGEENNERKY